MTLKFDEIIAPSHWASYLINNDASGIDANEVAAADRRFAGYHVVSCDDEDWFTWSADLHGATSKGGHVTNYTVQKV